MINVRKSFSNLLGEKEPFLIQTDAKRTSTSIKQLDHGIVQRMISKCRNWFWNAKFLKIQHM